MRLRNCFVAIGMMFRRHSSEAKCAYKIVLNTGVCSSRLDVTQAASCGRRWKNITKITCHTNASKATTSFIIIRHHTRNCIGILHVRIHYKELDT